MMPLRRCTRVFKLIAVLSALLAAAYVGGWLAWNSPFANLFVSAALITTTAHADSVYSPSEGFYREVTHGEKPSFETRRQPINPPFPGAYSNYGFRCYVRRSRC